MDNSSLIRFPSEDEALEFCKDNHISTDNLMFDGEYYSIKSSSNRKVIPTQSRNSYGYPGLEKYSDKQINMFEIQRAIIKTKHKNKAGKYLYSISWERVHRK